MKILIAIHGSHAQPVEMQAQRETWLQDLHGAADYKFFLGYPGIPDDDVVLVENVDGPVWEGKPGLRRSLVLNIKTEALARYAFENDYDFVFKCDDDTYVRVPALLESGFEQHDYVGCTEQHYTVRLGWYRWAGGGGGYWLSRRAMEVIAENGARKILAEDFSVGNTLATHGIHPHHDDRYASALTAKQLADPDPRLITLHKANPDWMRRLHCRYAVLQNPVVDSDRLPVVTTT